VHLIPHWDVLLRREDDSLGEFAWVPYEDVPPACIGEEVEVVFVEDGELGDVSAWDKLLVLEPRNRAEVAKLTESLFEVAPVNVQVAHYLRNVLLLLILTHLDALVKISGEVHASGEVRLDGSPSSVRNEPFRLESIDRYYAVVVFLEEEDNLALVLLTILQAAGKNHPVAVEVDSSL